MTMLLLVNKPITAFLYILGVCLMVLLSFQDGDKYFFTAFWLIPTFSILYFTSINYIYLLRGDKKLEIKGVDIRFCKGPVRVYWFMSLIGLLIGIWIFNSNGYILFLAAIFLLFYNAIAAVILKCVIYAKFFSLAVKKNPTIKDFKAEDFYTDVREVLLKKVID